MSKQTAVHIDREAEENIFEDCDIVGGTEIYGKRNKMIRTRIRNSKKKDANQLLSLEPFLDVFKERDRRKITKKLTTFDTPVPTITTTSTSGTIAKNKDTNWPFDWRFEATIGFFGNIPFGKARVELGNKKKLKK